MNYTAKYPTMDTNIETGVFVLLKVKSLIILPIMTILSTLVNTLCWKILSRKKQKNNVGTIHLKFLIAIDLISIVTYLPQIFFSEESCLQTSYAWAFYKAHIRSSVAYATKWLQIYTLMSLTADRFTAVYFAQWYRTSNKFTKVRLSIAVVFIIISITPALILGSIEKVNEGYIATSVFRSSKIPNTKIYRIYCLACMVLIPMISIISLSILIAHKLIRGSPALQQNKDYIRNAVSILIINVIYITLTVIYGAVLFNNTTTGKCYSNTVHEMVLLTCESLLLVWSIINVVVFLAICREYKQETIIFLKRVGLMNQSSENQDLVE